MINIAANVLQYRPKRVFLVLWQVHNVLLYYYNKQLHSYQERQYYNVFVCIGGFAIRFVLCRYVAGTGDAKGLVVSISPQSFQSLRNRGTYDILLSSFKTRLVFNANALGTYVCISYGISGLIRESSRVLRLYTGRGHGVKINLLLNWYRFYINGDCSQEPRTTTQLYSPMWSCRGRHTKSIS